MEGGGGGGGGTCILKWFFIAMQRVRVSEGGRVEVNLYPYSPCGLVTMYSTLPGGVGLVCTHPAAGLRCCVRTPWPGGGAPGEDRCVHDIFPWRRGSRGG